MSYCRKGKEEEERKIFDKWIELQVKEEVTDDGMMRIEQWQEVAAVPALFVEGVTTVKANGKTKIFRKRKELVTNLPLPTKTMKFEYTSSLNIQENGFIDSLTIWLDRYCCLSVRYGSYQN